MPPKTLLINLKSYEDVTFYLYKDRKFVDCYVVRTDVIGSTDISAVEAVRYTGVLKEGGYDPSTKHEIKQHKSIEAFDEWLRFRVKELSVSELAVMTRQSKVIRLTEDGWLDWG